MGTPAQNKANLNNSSLSTGPRTSAGKRKASQNAYKHGLRSNRDQLLREESLAFEARMHRWSAPGGEDDVKEFLIQDNVSLSFRNRTREAIALLNACARRYIENADDAELEAVRDLGCAVIFRLHWTDVHIRHAQIRTPRKTERPGRRRPFSLMTPASSSKNCSPLCTWMLLAFGAVGFLKDRLHTGRGHWVPSDKFRAIRLISKQPIDAVDCKTVASDFYGQSVHCIRRASRLTI